MSDAAIREALRAAEKAVADVFCGEAHDDDRLVIATAVQAFLRALPDRFPMPGEHNPACQVWGHSKGEMRRLAAAVARAAREGE